jgi:hypothetical protein
MRKFLCVIVIAASVAGFAALSAPGPSLDFFRPYRLFSFP